jgi:hypothetical protein
MLCLELLSPSGGYRVKQHVVLILILLLQGYLSRAQRPGGLCLGIEDIATVAEPSSGERSPPLHLLLPIHCMPRPVS